MRTHCGIRQVGIACAGSTFNLFVYDDPVVGYIVASLMTEVQTLWYRLYADCFLHD